MIALSPTMKQLLSAKYEQSNSSKKVMWVFSGNIPTKNQITALVQSDGTVSSNALKALGTLRLSVAYPATVLPRKVNADLLRWELAQRNEAFTTHSPGVANWFVFMYVATNINEPAYSTDAKIYQAFIGAVGDIGTPNVDMELLGGQVESDKIYKTTDFEIKTLA
jgi:hypothetical protein